MGNNASNSVLHNIDSVVTRLAGRSSSASAGSPIAPTSSDDAEIAAARRLVCEVLRASVKEVLRQQLRSTTARVPPQAEVLQVEAERLVAGVLEAAIDVLVEELVPDLHSMNGPTKCKNAQIAIVGPPPPQQQQNQPDSNDQNMALLTEIASRMVNTRLNDSQLSSAVEQITRHRSEFRLPEARPKSSSDDRTVAVDLARLGPYLRCLSHAGVLSEGSGGPATTLLMFDATRLPDCDSVRGYDGIMMQLLTLLCHAVRQLRTPSFSLVFVHSPATRGQFPKVGWMKQAAAWLKAHSSLRRIYVLHSTFSLSTLAVLSRTFTSRSFRDLVISVSSVQQLHEQLPLLATSARQQLEALSVWESNHKGFGF